MTNLQAGSPLFLNSWILTCTRQSRADATTYLSNELSSTCTKWLKPSITCIKMAFSIVISSRKPFLFCTFIAKTFWSKMTKLSWLTLVLVEGSTPSRHSRSTSLQDGIAPLSVFSLTATIITKWITGELDVFSSKYWPFSLSSPETTKWIKCTKFIIFLAPRRQNY